MAKIATLNAEGEFLEVGLKGKGMFTVSGTWDTTLTIQVSHDNGANWRTLIDPDGDLPDGEIEENMTKIIQGPENETIKLRIGFLTGDYASGAAVVEFQD